MFKWKKRVLISIRAHSIKPIDVESYVPKSIKLDKMWVPQLRLKQSDKEILLSRTAWLNDDINAAQKLLKKANSSIPGLQDVCCGLTMNFDVEPGEFIQILHTGHGHWNTVSTVGVRHSEVQIFDSMYMCIYPQWPRLKLQICSTLWSHLLQSVSWMYKCRVESTTVGYSLLHLPLHWCLENGQGAFCLIRRK